MGLNVLDIRDIDSLTEDKVSRWLDELEQAYFQPVQDTQIAMGLARATRPFGWDGKIIKAMGGNDDGYSEFQKPVYNSAYQPESKLRPANNQPRY